MWPSMVYINELQSRLLHDGIPLERVMHTVTQVSQLVPGDKFKVERTEGDLYLYATVNPGYFAVANE